MYAVCMLCVASMQEGEILFVMRLKYLPYMVSVFSRLYNAETKFSVDLWYLSKQTKHGV